jgi:hypothetical protein
MTHISFLNSSGDYLDVQKKEVLIVGNVLWEKELEILRKSFLCPLTLHRPGLLIEITWKNFIFLNFFYSVFRQNYLMSINYLIILHVLVGFTAHQGHL